jgi:subtilisin family serine protease
MLRSVRSLIENLSAERLRLLPAPPVPVQLEVDENDLVVISLLVTLPAGDSDNHQSLLSGLAEHGFRMTTWAGRIAAGYMNLRDTDALEKLEGDLYIEAAHVVHPEIDVSVPEAWHSPHRWPLWAGRDVLVGIVDAGIDPAHPSLRTAFGGTRIVRLWDQTKKMGPAAWPAGYRYGAEWDSAAIDRYLAPAANVAFPGKVAQHGTAVAGIAAGNGLCAPAGRYVGVAPGADLVVVTLNASARTFASTQNVIDAINYVFAVAGELGKRAVVNLSEGSQLGAHDPNEQLALGISELLAEDEKRVVVTSMGNTGEEDAHARFFVPAGGSVDLEIDVPRHVGPYVTLDLWYDVADAVSVQVIDPAGNPSSVADHDLPYGETLGSDKCDIKIQPNVPAVDANQIVVTLTTVDNMGDVAKGRWIVRLTDGYVPSGQPFHGWLARGMTASPSFAPPYADPDCTMTQPAAAREILPVSAYCLAPRLGTFAELSSRGPDRLGRELDGLAAPGRPVTSCSAAALYPGSPHVADSGTSYAAAHVTGAVAVLLGRQPSITRKQVIDCLLANARTDQDTANGPASGWGAGKLDISAALDCALTPW